jgi:adenylate cyclase class IV
MSKDLQFLEIEHKFIIGPDVDLGPLLEGLRLRGPEKSIQTDVQDTYFLVEHAPHAIYRHRIDSYLQQLTVKSLGSDNEIRLEVNLHLDPLRGNQIEGIQAFLAPLGVLWQGTLRKEVQAFYFADAEVVIYRAQYEQREICCLEIEARAAHSIKEAQEVLSSWEKLMGLDPAGRSHASLLELLVLPSLSPALQAKVQTMRN